MIETESTLAITHPTAIDLLKSLGVTKVMASTQYGMGFLLVELGPPDVRGCIVFRDDSLDHDARRTLAEEINALLNQ